jgi:hypothetical protein
MSVLGVASHKLSADKRVATRMAGVVAIISHERTNTVTSAEVDALAATYESLRGERPDRHTAASGTWARAIVMGTRRDGRPTIEEQDGSWAASIGVLVPGTTLLGSRLADLEGHFGLVSYDGRDETLTVATDPRAFQPMYWAERDGKTYVCDSALVLAKHLRARPSRLGILTFLRCGYHFGAMTSWEGITRLDPGTCLTFKKTGRARDFYFRPQVDREVARLGFDEAVECCNEVAFSTVEQWLPPERPVWSDLTGGYDSRLLGLLLEKANIPFETDTRGDYTDDRRIARMVAEVTGWKWTDVTVPPDWPTTLPEMLRMTVNWSDGHLDAFELAWVLWAHSTMSERHPIVLYAGGGEHLRSYCWRQEFPFAGKRSRVNFDNWVDLRLIHPVNLSVFANDPTPEVRADVLRRMQAWDGPYTDELNTTRLDLMFSYKMTGHFGIYRSADGAFIRSEVPLYSKRMYQTALSVNYRYRRNHRLVRNMIARLNRAVASVETDVGGPAEPWRLTNIHRFAPYYTQLVRKGLNKAGQKVLGRHLVAPVESANWWCPPAARRNILDSVTENGPLSFASMRSAPLFDEHAIGDLFRRAREDGALADTGLLGRIIAVELALQAADAAVA